MLPACQIVRGTTGNSGDWPRVRPGLQHNPPQASGATAPRSPKLPKLRVLAHGRSCVLTQADVRLARRHELTQVAVLVEPPPGAGIVCEEKDWTAAIDLACGGQPSQACRPHCPRCMTVSASRRRSAMRRLCGGRSSAR